MRAGRLPDDLEGMALRLRRLSGIGVQVRGIVGVANRVYDREGIVPILTGAQFGSLVDDEVALMELVLGRPGTTVGSADREAARRLDLDLQQRLRSTADDLAHQQGGAGSVLTSVSMLGRLDHIRLQLSGFPGEED
jgi:hypothetical protein